MTIILCLIFLLFFRHYLGPQVFYYLFYQRWREASLQSRKSIKSFPSEAQIQMEKKYMALAALCEILVLALSIFLVQNNYTRMYFHISEYGWLYTIFSFFLLLVLQDTYFYFTHRTMHWMPLYKKIHYIHHKSKNTNPWSSYSAHPIEKIIDQSFFPLVIMVIPLHPYLVLLFMAYSSTISIWGHTGYEINPFEVRPNGFTRFGSTTTFHNFHHEFFHCNYSFHFSFWDKILGTEHPDYGAALDRMNAKK